MDEKPTSRKLIMTYIQLGIILILPIAHKCLGIGGDITMVCLTASVTITGGYLAANVLVKAKSDAAE